MNPDELLRLCMNAVQAIGLKTWLVLSGRPLSQQFDSKLHIRDTKEKAQFSGESIELSWREALGLAVIALYHQAFLKPYRFRAILQVDDAARRSKEQTMSDGAITRTDKKTRQPFQQVLAQNIIGTNKNKNIESIVLDCVKDKASKRSSYPTSAGLAVSVFPSKGAINIGKLTSLSEANVFKPTLLLLFQHDFKKADVYRLDGSPSPHDLVTKRLSVNLNY